MNDLSLARVPETRSHAQAAVERIVCRCTSDLSRIACPGHPWQASLPLWHRLAELYQTGTLRMAASPNVLFEKPACVRVPLGARSGPRGPERAPRRLTLVGAVGRSVVRALRALYFLRPQLNIGVMRPSIR